MLLSVHAYLQTQVGRPWWLFKPVVPARGPALFCLKNDLGSEANHVVAEKSKPPRAWRRCGAAQLQMADHPRASCGAPTQPHALSWKPNKPHPMPGSKNRKTKCDFRRWTAEKQPNKRRLLLSAPVSKHVYIACLGSVLA